MRNFASLLSWELRILNKANNFIKCYLSLLLFCILSIVVTNSQEDAENFGVIFTIIYIPISLIGFSDQIFRHDVEDGYMELLFTSFTGTEIIIVKYLALLLTVELCCLISLPVILLAFNTSLSLVMLLFCILSLVLILSCGVVILISSMQVYFRYRTNLLQMLIMFLIIPSMLIAGLILHNHLYSLFLILIGINMVLIPIIIILSSFLISNIYNFE